MNKKIEQLIMNTHGLCLDRMRDDSSLFIDNLFEDDFLKVSVPLLYDVSLGDELKKQFSYENLKENILKLIKPKIPTRSFAEDRLEDWLDSSIRSNGEEFRFNAYKKYLSKENKADIITQLDADTFKILNSCYNPNELDDEWDRRGLVYGHVQSGKTANYIGLINRAFDAGYRIIIVLTGMTEDLRSQTQKRIDEGVIGQREGVKIGIAEDNPMFNELEEILPATSLKKDLKKDDDWRDHTISLNKKSIWVIKKNKSVLENLIMWLDKQRIKDSTNKIHNVPFLVIDDEADNASIQSMTKKEYEIWGEGQDLVDIDSENLTLDQEKALKKAKERVIKAINRNIRVMLSLMSHKTFVAYTATPYSIVSQTEKDTEKSVIIGDKTFNIDENSDLFPSHFIIPITAGEKYMGIERIFPVKRSDKLPVVVNVSRSYPNERLDENYFPNKRGDRYLFTDIPTSLEDAILHFLVSIVIRNYRGQKDYNCLLVHTSHLTDNADYLADKIDRFLNKLKVNLPGDNGGYFNRIEKIFEGIKLNSENNLFKKYFNQKYSFPDKISKNEILNIITAKKDPLFSTVSYHSSNSKNLKHKIHDLSFNIKKFKNYIVVGGNRLSRGLTLEGLTTSYFVRNSTRQDSLYQMGRWFGYRVGYEDLVRIFIPTDQILWFEGVYRLEMDLRKLFEENNEEDEDVKLLPRDAVIKLAYYTKDDLYTSEDISKKFPAICDPKKLMHTRKEAISKSGTTKTNRVINDRDIQKENLNTVKSLFDAVKKDTEAELFDVNNNSVPIELKNNKNCNYINVNYKYITTFLENYIAHEKIVPEITALINFIKKNKDEISRWSLVLVNRGKVNNSQFRGDFYENGKRQENKLISIVKRNESAQLEPNNNDAKTIYFKSILEGGQKDNIFDIINTDNYTEFSNAKEKNIRQSDIIKKYRNETKKPLMLIIPAHSSKAKNIEVIPLVYCFIPVIENAEKVTYIIRNS